MKKIMFVMILVLLLAGCSQKTEEKMEEEISLSVTLQTIEYSGTPSSFTEDFYDDRTYEYMVPWNITPLNDKFSGRVCNGFINASNPLTEIPYTIIPQDPSINLSEVSNEEFKNLELAICFETTFEYKGITINGKFVDVSFDEADCNNSIITKDGNKFINLSYTKLNCINLTEGD